MMETFEHMDCDLSRWSICSYRCHISTPPSKNNGLKTTTFLENEWPTFLAKYATIPNDIGIVGDMNFHLDIVDDLDALRFIGILDLYGLHQHVCEPTHVHGHTLEVAITRNTSTIVSDVEVTDAGLIAHLGNMSVKFTADINKPAPIQKTVSFRKLHAIDVDTFKRDITDSTILHPFNGSRYELANAYNNGLHSLVDKHAPLCTKIILLGPPCPLYSTQLHEAMPRKQTSITNAYFLLLRGD